MTLICDYHSFNEYGSTTADTAKQICGLDLEKSTEDENVSALVVYLEQVDSIRFNNKQIKKYTETNKEISWFG